MDKNGGINHKTAAAVEHFYSLVPQNPCRQDGKSSGTILYRLIHALKWSHAKPKRCACALGFCGAHWTVRPVKQISCDMWQGGLRETLDGRLDFVCPAILMLLWTKVCVRHSLEALCVHHLCKNDPKFKSCSVSMTPASSAPTRNVLPQRE